PAGTQTFTATDMANSAITATAGTTVQPGAAAAYVISGLPNPSASGMTYAVTIRANDSAGNMATTYAGPANLTSSDSTAAFPATVAFSSGPATGRVTPVTAATQSFTATGSVMPTVTCTAMTLVQ